MSVIFVVPTEKYVQLAPPSSHRMLNAQLNPSFHWTNKRNMRHLADNFINLKPTFQELLEHGTNGLLFFKENVKVAIGNVRYVRNSTSTETRPIEESA